MNHQKPVALVTGAAGQLGAAMAARFEESYAVVALTRADLDVTDHAAVVQRVTDAQAAVIINCAAYNDVDGAENNATTAFAVNSLAVKNLSRAAERAGALLVHYSTDFVFDGETLRPYTEPDLPCPQSIYAQSKLVGEWMAASTPRHYVLRVESLFGGRQARSSIDRIIAALRDGKEARVFSDRVVSPTFVDDVVEATGALIVRQPAYGLYHCVNSGHTTWCELAEEIARLMNDPKGTIVPISVRDVPLRARRPRYAALDNSKLNGSIGYQIPTWQDAVARYVKVS